MQMSQSEMEMRKATQMEKSTSSRLDKNDDAVSDGTTWIVKGGNQDDMQSEGSYMVRVGAKDDM